MVLISSSSEITIADAKEEILAETGAETRAVQTVVCDLSEPDRMANTLEDAIDILGKLMF